MKGDVNKIGWILVAAAVGLCVASGFEAASLKLGVVDVEKLANESKPGVAAHASIDKMHADRAAVLQFLADNSVMTLDQAKQIRDLSLKAAPTVDEQAQLAKLKSDATADENRAIALDRQPTLTAEEHRVLDDFAQRSKQTQAYDDQLRIDFDQELKQAQLKANADILRLVYEKINDVAKTDGYSVVYDVKFAPYAANDLTDGVMTALGTK